MGLAITESKVRPRVSWKVIRHQACCLLPLTFQPRALVVNATSGDILRHAAAKSRMNFLPDTCSLGELFGSQSVYDSRPTCSHGRIRLFFEGVEIDFSAQSADLGEERRLLYVAMTRAKEFLFGTWAGQRRGPTARAGRPRVRGRRQHAHFFQGGPVRSQDGPTSAASAFFPGALTSRARRCRLQPGRRRPEPPRKTSTLACP